MLLPWLVLLDGLNPDGDRGSPRARYRRVGGNQRQLGEERKKSKRVTMFWGPGWEFELYVAWRGGAKGSADTVRRRGAAGETRWDGRRGERSRCWQQGGIAVYSQAWAFPIQECREDSSKVGQPTKTRHICSRRFGRRSNEDVSPT